jgi:di/tricarboxylate transporter
MTSTQIILFLILAATLLGFVWGRWRYDVVAGVALLAAVYLGVVPPENAFLGFSHPAVVSVAAVLVISRALQETELVNWLVRMLAPARLTPTTQVAAGSGLTLLLSAVMNNIGALALMLPVTIRNASLAKRPASLLLIPLSFASLLGGLITLIGTPPNLVISAFRAEHVGKPFLMFDFTPVGLTIAIIGLVYLAIVGWRLIPARETEQSAKRLLRKLTPFVAEVRLPEGSSFNDRQVRHVEEICGNEVTIMTVLRHGEEILAPRPIALLRAGDILVIKGEPGIWEPLCDGKQFDLLSRNNVDDLAIRLQDAVIAEAVVMPNSALERRSARNMRMHTDYGVNLLALARRGEPQSRLKDWEFQVGDTLLVQGERNTLERALADLGCLILADGGGAANARKKGPLLPIAIFAVALVAAGLGLVSVPISLVSAVAALILARTISLQDAYESIDWPILVLIGALMPIGQAMTSTGAAGHIASQLVALAGAMPLWAIIGLVMAVSMWLSDLIHNTPTAVLMAPISAGIAEGLQLSIDPFLMAVAVGSASAYLTPIGHQSNTLVMGPGAYRFTDYTRVGIGLELLILLVGVPMILFVWPA